ncbi:MAG: DNA cytosine methyltransferase [Mesorhizobium sp.]|nr:MAG: DNA cytosine methyltransferase [Mesorhizobium sp.]
MRGKKNSPRVASFFAGAGGLDIGFSQAGFQIVYATDHDGDCCETLSLNEGRATSRGGFGSRTPAKKIVHLRRRHEDAPEANPSRYK